MPIAPLGMTGPLDVEDLRARVDKALNDFLETQVSALESVGRELERVHSAVGDFLLDGGKRLRPAFAYWGYRGAGGADGEQIVAAAAALELLHACALVHDDVMDASSTRRGRPAVHRQFAMLHQTSDWHGSPDAFGVAAAVLFGDICLVWADAMLWSCGLSHDALLRAQPVYALMRSELMGGQYLDVLASALGSHSVDRSLRVAKFKSAKYTVERPLHLGAALAGAGPEIGEAYSAYGLALGEAFQLRDDMLGVFGDPATTGKPAGDDLREGKSTVLVALALEQASTAQAETVHRLLGDPALGDDGVDTLRQILVETGAVSSAEELIERGLATALATLDEACASRLLTDEAVQVLRALAIAATSRTQ